MAITISPNPFSISSELGATQDITVSGLSYYNLPDNCSVRLLIKVNGVTVKTLTAEPTTTSYAFNNIDFNSVKTAIYDNAEGAVYSTCVTVTAENSRISPPATISATTTAGSLTIAARNSALVTTANVIDMSLANPANLTFSWTRPHAAFRARIKFYVWNGTTYEEIFNRYGFGATNPSSSADLKDYGGTDYTPAIVGTEANQFLDGAMQGVSPRNYKVELYTQFNFSTLRDLGTLNDSDIITNGIIYPFGGKIKVYGSSFAAKPVKVWNGTSWVEKPVKHWTGTEWKKSKN